MINVARISIFCLLTALGVITASFPEIREVSEGNVTTEPFHVADTRGEVLYPFQMA